MIDLDFLAQIRADELRELERALPAGARILEIGGGTGQQALMLAERGFEIVSIDVETSEYREHRVFPVLDYDGSILPFPDNSFDVVFSSNVLEHVSDLEGLLAEQARVLRPDGIGVHAMPTFAWRFWTTVTHYPDVMKKLALSQKGLLRNHFEPIDLIRVPLRSAARVLITLVRGALPERHGERGNVISELAYFRAAWWRHEFEAHGYSVLDDRPMGLFYTGYMSLGKWLGIGKRHRLSRVLGSACHLYKIRPQSRIERKDG